MKKTKAEVAEETLHCASCLIEFGPKDIPIDVELFVRSLPLIEGPNKEEIIEHEVSRLRESKMEYSSIDVSSGVFNQRSLSIDVHGLFIRHPPFYDHPNRIIELTTYKDDLNVTWWGDNERVAGFMQILKQTFDNFKPTCMWAGRWIDYHWDIAEVLHGLPHKMVYGVAYYGNKIVDLIGRDRLLSAPVWKVEERPWKGIILQLEENPFHLGNNKLHEKVSEYLGLAELDFSSISPKFEWKGYSKEERPWA